MRVVHAVAIRHWGFHVLVVSRLGAAATIESGKQVCAAYVESAVSSLT